MFRREKENRLDNEGLRRMREAIRQRLDAEGNAEDAEDEAVEETYRAATPPPANDDDVGQVAPFDPDTLPGYGPTGGGNESNYGYLTSGRQDRTLPSFESPAVPARNETPSWLSTPVPPPTQSTAPAPAPAAAAPAPAAPPRPAGTTVAADTTWRGTLRSAAAIQIDGSFEGQIETEQTLTVSEDARVEATVRAASIVVAGQLNGQVSCRERLEILSSGRVSGQIDAGKFVVHEGAYLGGQVRMTGTAANGEGTRPTLQRVR